jgi:post-segregation antitoxin (ccd killing protein)
MQNNIRSIWEKKVNFLFFQLVLPVGEKLSKAVTVSTKIPTELKEKLKQLKIKPSKLLRKAIEDEVRRREAKKLKDDIEKLKPTLDRVSMDDIVKSIREDRTRR